MHDVGQITNQLVCKKCKQIIPCKVEDLMKYATTQKWPKCCEETMAVEPLTPVNGTRIEGDLSEASN